MTMSEIPYEAVPTADAHAAPTHAPFVRRIWPQAVIVFGLGITAAWICLLGYGIVKLIEMAI